MKILEEDYFYFIHNLSVHFLYSDRVDWNQLKERIKSIINIKNEDERIHIYLQVILYYLDDAHSSYELIEEVQKIKTTSYEFESIVSPRVVGKNKVTIFINGIMKEYEYNNLDKYYNELFWIFDKINIKEVEIDISNFLGGHAELSILFIKFLFQKQKLSKICYLVEKDDETYLDLASVHQCINLKTKKIPYLDQVASVKIKIGSHTFSSGQMLCVALLEASKLYSKFRYTGCDTIGNFNNAIVALKFGNYHLNIPKFHFMSSNFWISKGPIFLKEINHQVQLMKLK